MKKICIELSDLIEALESEGDEEYYYLNLLSGEVVKVSSDYCADETVSQVDYNNSENFFKITPLSSDELLNIRENFLKYINNENLRDKLEIALIHRGPLRRFADIVKNDAPLYHSWKEFQEKSMKPYIQNWINSLQVIAEII